ncbi:MAG TPA: bifunctional copper resistance protein CopD/cytochrome c oxidase assembly protein [Stackebrandtia sp.]|uniref:bifunctional copper resistance protein CopD/cytochrome c oxidase assembly protein n=1 Tax=Stackebrandtia sp. TaxID=2023065 RepID=UPI002D4D165C|nr:bifunctional copper resistance protein CopD/cytochrome c oxidase assembly protein [Stackebrandtia sp.]HZE37761.1 bifunctional copper resistance protein CopD/cytochrome c oxidase assembly protein [Stackebrandtia sp.]
MTQQGTAPKQRVIAPRALVLGGAVVAGVGVAVVVLLVGGGVVTDAIPGLPARDVVVAWLVPMLKLGNDVLAAAVVGCCVAAGFFVDGDEGRVRARAYRWLRIGGWCAVAWAVVAIAQAPANLADTTVQPLSNITVGGVWSYIADTENGLAYTMAAVLALIAAVIALNTLTVTGAAFASLFAVAAALPQVFTGHATASGDHQIAVDSMIFHVLGALLWAGGLLALLLARKLDARAPRRYSALALVAFVAVGVSGVVNAATRIHRLGDLASTAYGREVLFKAAALLILGGFGLWHRRATLPKLDDNPGLFRRFAGVELVVMAATFGLAAALSRTPSPPSDQEESAARSLLGFEMPPPLTARSLVADWYPELVICTIAAVSIGLYLAGVVRLYRRGDRWPISRTALWTVGWLITVFVTSSGMGRYGMVLFSVHMIQHMTLNMLVPILLVLAAPITLALRAFKPSSGRGPREWLTLVLHSRVVRFVSHPLIALGLYAFSLYMMYFTGLFEWAMRSHAGHLYMLFHFLAAGGLFYWLIIGPDPSPRQIPYPLKVLLFFVAVVFHTIFGLTIMQSADVIAIGWYDALGRMGHAALLASQHAAGGIAWGFGEPPSVIVLGALIWQWSNSEDRAARRIDRISDRAQASGHPEDDPHEQYNAYLARLAEADRKAGLRD